MMGGALWPVFFMYVRVCKRCAVGMEGYMSEHGSTIITESHISILHVPFWSGGVVWPAPPPLAGVGLPYPAPNDWC